jgi:2-hydroxychromene-2-carboxylate isomerase
LVRGVPVVADIDFWFTMGSTYSYLSAMRLPDLERATGVIFRWRPFSLRTILQEMKRIPFADKPAKCAYMWRDIERRAAMYGFSVRLPAPYPLKQNALANKLAIIGMEEG